MSEANFLSWSTVFAGGNNLPAALIHLDAKAATAGIVNLRLMEVEQPKLADEELRSEFARQAEQWEEHNLGQSVIDYHHTAIRTIVRMGKQTIPLLLEKLTQGEVEWVYALKSITKARPETGEMRGDPERVIAAWLEWGRNNGYPLATR